LGGSCKTKRSAFFFPLESSFYFIFYFLPARASILAQPTGFSQYASRGFHACTAAGVNFSLRFAFALRSTFITSYLPDRLHLRARLICEAPASFDIFFSTFSTFSNFSTFLELEVLRLELIFAQVTSPMNLV
jgi:hypothetical protein